ncbi:DUF6384 family protein [Pararhizobium sp. BT-229]|uniref:DUF6384 family protein n=1 Tax=Pararhizobium sp. BT-229 TaxID=2986923 RepID=UPI0021F6A0BA|nr:DUF6384 family protein [Pararhizobium sp. BT-229]MCV9963846.1 DUF6384 family protein [Pararhizobium sp. BT-229]
MSQSRTPLKSITPPPSADDLLPHEPLTGLKGVVARACIRRIPHVAGVAALAVGLAAAGLTLTGGLSSGVPVEEVTPAATPAETKAVAAAPSTLLLPPAILSEGKEETPSLARGKTPSSETKAATASDIPVIKTPVTPAETATAEKLPAVPGVGADMQSIDMGELASAVDALGIRTEELEKSLPMQEKEPPPAEGKVAKVEPAEAQPVKAGHEPASLPGMSAEDAAVHDRLAARLAYAEAKGDASARKSAKAELDMFEATLNTLIEFRIVDRKGEKPGFWRTLVGDDATKQFFVVVEAVVDGKTVNWAVRDADSGKVVSGAKFGLRVDEKTFAELSADKKDDGRIGRMAVGLKPVGRITPVWSIKTDGETITGF